MPKYTLDQIKQHKSKDSCWVVIRDNVYDVTEFMPEHPGGLAAILKRGGRDVTKLFENIHAPGLLEKHLKPIGVLETAPEPTSKAEVEDKPSKTTLEQADTGKIRLPALANQLNFDDFEKTAKSVLSPTGWSYYYSASDDHRTKSFNNSVFEKVLLRPRVFKNVAQVDTTSSILGYQTSLPVFVSPAAQARFGHPSGENGIARACASRNVLQMVSHNASMTFEEIVAGAPANQMFGYQLYVHDNRAKSEQRLRQVFDTGKCNMLILTLDAPTPGKRELDERAKVEDDDFFDENEEPSTVSADAAASAGGVGKALFAGTAADLTWADLQWLRDHTPAHIPIILKGLQTYEDALLASQAVPAVSGIILSNHGGRAMDQSQPPLLVLEEIRTYCPEVFERLEIYIDGGIKRGTDVIKALCLGAKQVGLGRPVLYGLAGYGHRGVERTFDIIQAEIETAMRLLGVNHLSELGPQHVNLQQLDALLYRAKL